MKFDITKVLTCVTAEQARIGQKGWFAGSLDAIKEDVLSEVIDDEGYEDEHQGA